MRRRHFPGVVFGMLVVAVMAACVAMAQQPADKNRPAAKPPAAAAPVAPDDGVEPALVMSASVASLDKVAAFAKEIGLGDLPLSTTFLEQQMPFIGEGGLSGDRPIGLLLYAGPGVDLERAATFVLPVNPGKAELKPFIEGAGAKPVDGRTDLVTLEGLGFRRSADLFIFGQMPRAVAAVKEDVLASAYAGSDALARVDLNVAAVKQAIPDRYAQFFSALDDAGDGGPHTTVEQASAAMVLQPMRAIDRLALTLSRADAGGLRVGIVADPVALPQDAPVKFDRPGFPAGTLVRADIAYPPAKAFARVNDVFTSLILLDPGFAARPKPEQEQIHALSVELMKLLFAGDAGSLGVEVVEGQPVVYWITRHTPGAGLDLDRDVQAIVARSAAVSKLAKDPGHPTVTHESYAVGGAGLAGTSAHRLILSEDGKPALYIDAIRRDDTVLMALAATGGKYVERLLPLKDDGEAMALVSGWLDLSALAAADLLPTAEDAGLGETALKELKAALKGQRLAWSAAPDGGALRLNVDVPAALLRSLAGVAGLTH